MENINLEERILVLPEKPTGTGWKKVPFTLKLPLEYRKGEGFYYKRITPKDVINSREEAYSWQLYRKLNTINSKKDESKPLTPEEVLREINKAYGWRFNIVNPEKVAIVPQDNNGVVHLYYKKTRVK